MTHIDIENILEHVPAVVGRLIRKNGEWRVDYITENIREYGYDKEELINEEVTWESIIHPDDLVVVLQTIDAYEKTSIDVFHLEYRIITKEKKSRPVVSYITANREQRGICSHDIVIVSQATPMACQHLVESHIQQQLVINDIFQRLHDNQLEEAIQIIIDRVGEYMNTSRARFCEWNEESKDYRISYEWANQGTELLTDAGAGTLAETNITIDLIREGKVVVNAGEIPEAYKEVFQRENVQATAMFAVYRNGCYHGFASFDERALQRKWNEEEIEFLLNISRLLSTIVARIDTADKLKISQQQIKEMAFTDYLTKISNRSKCDILLNEAIERAKQSKKIGYLVFIDLDDFKIVNDCYGHDYGDEILINIATWLNEKYETPNHAFRFGGDEFVVLIDGDADVDLKEEIRRLHERASQPWKAKDKEFTCTFSIGIAQYPMEGVDSKGVVKQADVAMYEAKRMGKNRHKLYDSGLDSLAKERLNMETILSNAMENDFQGFEVEYQPVVDKESGSVRAAEALLRIRHEGATVLPGEFLPLAEYLGFTLPIGEFVFRKALKTCKKIVDSGYSDFKMIVNLTNRQIQEKNILAKFEKIVKEVGIENRNILISYSEKNALENFEKVQMISNQLKEEGTQVIMDQFGGGSASFLQLHELPVKTITTSLSLIQNLQEVYAKDFAKLIIELCHSMNKKVCVNGVETKEEYDFCMKSEADYLQGFYLYNVIKETELLELMKE